MAESVAVVTGGTKGLGRAVSLALATRGYRVLALYRSDARAADDLDALAQTSNLSIRSQRCDLTHEELVLAEPEFAAERLVLVHGAALHFVPAPVHLTSDEQLARHWEVAVKGLITCVRPLLRMLSRTSGITVVGISSRAAVGAAAPPAGFAGYAAAKAAMTMLLRGLAHEYAKRGLRTFSYAPSFMPTELTAGWPAALREKVAASGQTTPELAATRIVSLIHDPSIPATGETYE